ncbi:hypothetical protein N0V93_000609 [Gnomoniopsis smithogilvyi]|uniref:Major facilitator superfamily (MFS) profile domain-containing protein n=1 Tax=Gnomoniopsis smithogilvyi TaxID=1191159 RepID=A0A9W8Z270_9PEZI|nr:hypothetical protein N0V93_000609 [Gnomoniopsis smithogilvyi]
MALQPSYGRLYMCFPLRTVFCICIAIFGAGSIICATSPNSSVFITGRAVQGTGAAGIFSGALIICNYIVSKEKLPIFVSIISSMYIVASVMGPTVGGVIASSSLTWRFCFWLNLPICASVISMTLFAFVEPERPTTRKSVQQKLASLDALSTLLLLGMIVALVLGLQWGGASLPWNDPKVWGCLVVSGLLLAIFIAVQLHKKERALIPIRLLTQRTVGFGCMMGTCLVMAMNTLTYYLPIYFQASRGVSTNISGIYIIALTMPDALSSFISGTAVTLTGHYNTWMVAGGAIMAIGSGFLTRLHVDSEVGYFIGFQILSSVGFGLAIQLPVSAMRNVLAEEDVPTATSLFICAQNLGSTVGLSVAQSIFLNTLMSKLREGGISERTVQEVIGQGAGDVNVGYIAAELVPLVKASYAAACTTTFWVGTATAVLASLSGGAMEWKHIPRVSKVSLEDSDQKESPAPGLGDQL